MIAGRGGGGAGHLGEGVGAALPGSPQELVGPGVLAVLLTRVGRSSSLVTIAPFTGSSSPRMSKLPWNVRATSK